MFGLRKTFVLMSIFGLVASEAAMAGFRVVNKSSSSGGGSSSMVSTAPEEEVVTGTSEDNNSCKSDKNVPFGLLNNLLIDELSYELVEGEKNGIKVFVPPFFEDCMDVKLRYKIVDGDVQISFINDYDFSSEGLNSGSPYEKYEQCLEKKGILSDGEFDAQAATAGDPKDYFINIPELNKLSKVNLYYDSPPPTRENGSYGPVHGDWQKKGCLYTENLDEQTVVAYKSPEYKAKERAQNVCETMDYHKILAEIRKLKSSELGNAKALIETLEPYLEKAREQRAEKVYKRLEEIGELFKPTAEDRKDGMKVGVDEDEARLLSDEYAKLLNELDELIYEPGEAKIRELLSKHSGASPDEKKEIEAEIKEINEKIGDFSKNKRKYGLDYVMRGLKEYALSGNALDIEGLRLKSANYARVYKGRTDARRGKKLTFQKADKRIENNKRRFERAVHEWEREYMARTGDGTPSKDVKRDISKIQKNYRNFLKEHNEREKKYASYCQRTFWGFAKNKAKCQRFMSPEKRQQRMAVASEINNKYRSRLSVANQRYQHYRTLEEEAARELASQFEYSDSAWYYDTYLDYGEYSGVEDPYYENYGFGTPRGHYLNENGMIHSPNPYGPRPMPTEPNMGNFQYNTQFGPATSQMGPGVIGQPRGFR